MKKNLITILCFLILISFVFGEFELMKRSRGYTEAVDYLTIKIKETTCDEFLKKGGLAEKIRGGHSHHCLPIDSKGKDTDDFKFVGRCLNSDKDIILSIFEVRNKRVATYKSKSDDKKHRSYLQVRKNEYEDEKDVEFYLTLKSGDKPLEFKIENFSLKNGHAYQVRRPKCIKAKNYCFKKDAKEELMVIDCISKKELEGKVDKDSKVYIEVTKRDSRPDTCSDRRNGYCCRYVNASPKGGICKLYKRKSSKYENNGDNKKDGENSQVKDDSKSKSVDEEEEEPLPVKSNETLETLLKDIGVNPEEVTKDSKKEPVSNNPSTNANEEQKQQNEGKEHEEEGEEAESPNEEIEKKSIDSNSIPVDVSSNKKDVSAPTQEKRQTEFEEEEPEFDMFEEEEVEKKNLVEQPKPHAVNFAKNEGPNSFVIPNLKKKKNEHKVTAKNVVDPQPNLIDLVKPVEVVKSVEDVKPIDVTPLVGAAKPVDVKPIDVKPVEDVKPVDVTPLVGAAKQVEDVKPLDLVKPISTISEQSQPQKI